MKRTLLNSLLAVLACISLAGPVLAQNPLVVRGATDPDPSRQIPWSRVPPTESMWMYEQQKRDFLDPTLAMRKKAEFTAWQRRQRLAAMNWYGFSNSRPSWNPTPFTGGSISPGWVGNDPMDRYRWSSATAPIVVRGQAVR